ncbi:RxLR effector protein [Phytophthora megakarya]|uniref:RxLR effector protein n=1 Tax=Phytophthora megakarya TaxID=4795 RepID=A0A225WCR8_9STRA|nr:RxLR effector protein [Phytophthora megakarya]
MRQNVFLFIVVVVIAIVNVTLTNAYNGDHEVRHLKGVQTSTEDNHALDAGDEERAGLNGVAAKVKGGQLDDIAAKAKAGRVDDAIAAAGGKKWQQIFGKMKAENIKSVNGMKAPTVNQNRWQAAVAKIQSGKLNKLDTTNNKWKGAFNKIKASGRLKNADKAKVVKVTEGVAKEIAKAPEKASKFKKFLEIAYGAVLTALIVIGFGAMVS